jgi:hypothetical protein
MECVGFGINLLSGNYEFACLLLIEDEEWWGQFGGEIEANWEIERIRLGSSRSPRVSAGSLSWTVHSGSPHH